MARCRHLSTASGFTCKLGVKPVVCAGCSMFQPLRSYMLPTVELEQPVGAEQHTSMYTKASETEHEKLLKAYGPKTTASGGCGCHKH